MEFKNFEKLSKQGSIQRSGQLEPLPKSDFSNKIETSKSTDSKSEL